MRISVGRRFGPLRTPVDSLGVVFSAMLGAQGWERHVDMNLKAAARRLDVHYQTVYRWVRSGELPSVKVGASYDVSESAIELFRERRRTVRGVDGSPAMDRNDEASSTGVLSDELELIRRSPAATRAVLPRVVDEAARLLDALCVVRLMPTGPDEPPEPITWSHPVPDRLREWSEIVVAHRAPLRLKRLDAIASRRELLVLDHVPQAAFAEHFGPEDRHLLDGVRPHTMMIAPIAVATSRVFGFLEIVRDQPGRLFTETEQLLATELGRSIGALFDHAEVFSASKLLRRDLAARLHEILSSTPDESDALGNCRRAVRQGPGAAVLIDHSGRLRAASVGFAELVGRPTIGSTDDQRVLAATQSTTDHFVLERLWSGGIDSISLTRQRDTPAGRLDVDLHASVIRWPDSRPAAVLAIYSSRPTAFHLSNPHSP